MILPPPSYEELFPQRSLEQGNTTLEDNADRRKEVKSVTCQKFNESNTDEILPLRDDPCRSFFSRVSKWGEEVWLLEIHYHHVKRLL